MIFFNKILFGAIENPLFQVHYVGLGWHNQLLIPNAVS